MIKRFSISAVLILMMTVSGYVMFNQHNTRCMLVGISKMDNHGDNIYISPDATETQIKNCLDLVKTAKDRNKELWGSIESNPVFIFCTNWDDYYEYGMYRTQAMSRMNFTGEYVIISPDGFNADDVSHEMCHTELYTRVGYFNDRKIPLWFHEGISMLVCNNYPDSYKAYLNEWHSIIKSGPEILPLNKITVENDFYASPSRSDLAYWRSGMEVMRWYEIYGKEGLLKLTNDLANGDDFYSAYKKDREQ